MVNQEIMDFKIGLAERIRAYCDAQEPPLSQRALSSRLGRHISTVNGYLIQPEMMPEQFIQLVAQKIPEFSGVWIEYRRLVESVVQGNPVDPGRSARRREIRKAAAALNDTLTTLLKLLDQLADEPPDAPAKAGRPQPARRRKG